MSVVMKCAICGDSFPSTWAISQHHRAEHPAEFKRRQKLKKQKRAAVEAITEGDADTPEVDPEQQLIADAVAVFETATESGMSLHARSRVLSYLTQRFGGYYASGSST